MNESRVDAQQKRAEAFIAAMPMTACQQSAVHWLSYGRAAYKLRALNKGLPADFAADANKNYEIADAIEAVGATALQKFKKQGCSMAPRKKAPASSAPSDPDAGDVP